MNETDLINYGIIKVELDVIVLNQYMQQCRYYTDKRCFIANSYELDEYCFNNDIHKNNYIDNVSEILEMFYLLPNELYCFENEIGQDIPPTYYTKVNKNKTPYGDLLVFEQLCGQVYKLFNSLGKEMEISEKDFDFLAKISWFESAVFESVEIRDDHSILVSLIGREYSWIIFDYNGVNLLIRDAGTSFLSIRDIDPNSIQLNLECDYEYQVWEKDNFEINVKIPKSNDLKAYLYQLNESNSLILSNLQDKPIQHGEIEGFLENISHRAILELLYSLNVFPRLLYFFQKDFKEKSNDHLIRSIEDLHFSNYPQLFTKIKDVSFEGEGCVAMQYFKNDNYQLFSPKGNAYSQVFKNVDFLVKNKFVEKIKTQGNLFLYTFYEFNTANHTISQLKSYEFNQKDNSIPLLNNFDRLPQQFFPTMPVWENFHKNEVLIQDNIGINITEEGLTFREYINLHVNDEEISLNVLKNHPSAFVLLNEDLQQNIGFITQVFINKINIYPYLDNELQRNEAILFSALNNTNLDYSVLNNFTKVDLQNERLMELVLSKVEDLDELEYLKNRFKINTNLINQIQLQIEAQNHLDDDDFPFYN